MAKLSQRFNVELYLSIAAVFLSLAALVVSVIQTRIARQQQYASVWPRLSMSTDVIDRNLKSSVDNQGVGPAIIKRVTITYRGHTYDNIQRLFVEQTGPLDGGFLSGELPEETVLKAGDSYPLFELSRNDEPMSMKLANMLRSPELHIRIVYQDIYGNEWQYDQGRTSPAPNTVN